MVRDHFAFSGEFVEAEAAERFFKYHTIQARQSLLFTGQYGLRMIFSGT
jgi:hypothetical protein